MSRKVTAELLPKACTGNSSHCGSGRLFCYAAATSFFPVLSSARCLAASSVW